MKLNKILEKQIHKILGKDFIGDEKFQYFLEEINSSYNTYEKDKELSDHAFNISDRDYKEIYNKLNNEIMLRNESIKKLKNAIENIQGDDQIILDNKEDDLLGIVSYLDKQITKRKEIEKELVAAKEAAEASTLSKELFLANMSHEIRTPMNAIFGMANQLSKTSLDEKQHFYLDTIHTAADNLLIIINDILDLSKVESGKLSLEKIGFEPKIVLGRVMQVMMHRAEEKGLNFINSFCDSNLSSILIGDPYRLNQILLNLVSNAIKFTQKGTVDIQCNVLENNSAKQKVKITITDTGIGMDEKFSKNLFQKFSQEDNSIIRKYGGTGLGMSICKELVDLMGGEIAVESKKGVGTSISITIEFEKGSMENLPLKDNIIIDTANLKGKKILVTDDNEMNQLVVETILHNYNAEIIKAYNGVEAIEKLKENDFDLILMDVQMPEMDGFEATKIIRETLNQEIPIIALTAFAIKGDNQKCLDAGMNDYLSKPFEENQLLNILSKWIKKNPEMDAASEMQINKDDMPLYSLKTLENLAPNNQIFLDKMISLFVELTPKSVVEMKSALKENDFDKIKKVAHRLKPSFDNMEIVSLKDDIKYMEHFDSNINNVKELSEKINKLNDITNSIIKDLNLKKK